MATAKDYASFIRKIAADYVPPDDQEAYCKLVLREMRKTTGKLNHEEIIRIIALALMKFPGTLNRVIQSTVKH